LIREIFNPPRAACCALVGSRKNANPYCPPKLCELTGLFVTNIVLNASRYDTTKVRIYVKFYKKTKSSLKLRRDDFVLSD
jgi:hypothetical protein